jgi:release factor H-coupled RctB family protein
MGQVAAMPDLHPGKSAPIGAAMPSTVLYPFLLGPPANSSTSTPPVSTTHPPDHCGRRRPRPVTAAA